MTETGSEIIEERLIDVFQSTSNQFNLNPLNKDQKSSHWIEANLTKLYGSSERQFNIENLINFRKEGKLNVGIESNSLFEFKFSFWAYCLKTLTEEYILEKNIINKNM